MLLRQKLLHAARQVRPRVKIRDHSLFIEQPHRWNSLNSKALTDLFVFVEVLRPGYPPRLCKIQKTFSVLIQRDADDFKSSVVKLLVGRQKRSALPLGTAPAPCGPEIQQHDLASQFREIDLRPIYGRYLEFNWSIGSELKEHLWRDHLTFR